MDWRDVDGVGFTDEEQKTLGEIAAALGNWRVVADLVHHNLRDRIPAVPVGADATVFRISSAIRLLEDAERRAAAVEQSAQLSLPPYVGFDDLRDRIVNVLPSASVTSGLPEAVAALCEEFVSLDRATRGQIARLETELRLTDEGRHACQEDNTRLVLENRELAAALDAYRARDDRGGAEKL